MLVAHKLSGAGNHFLLIDTRRPGVRVPVSRRRKLVRQLCDPYFSIGADGVVFLEKSKGADLRWDFYNADGSSAEMCGNAARVVGLYSRLFDKKIGRDLTLETRAGLVGIRDLNGKSIAGRVGGQFQVEMPAIRDVTMGRDFDYVNSGVPHAVVSYGYANLQAHVDKLGKIVENIRSLRQFKKHGTNVTFYHAKRGRPTLDSLTFERGVAGFTQACGTGAVAAATAFAARQAMPKAKVTVKVPGGSLRVELGGPRPILSGPAIYIGEIHSIA